VTAGRGSGIYTSAHLRSRHSGAGRDSYFPPDLCAGTKVLRQKASYIAQLGWFS